MGSDDSWRSPCKPAGPTDSTEWGRDVLPEILPAFVQDWFLFVDSGLDTLERNVLHAELKGDFDVRSVEAALRKHWADADLRRRDQEKGRHMANLADEETWTWTSWRPRATFKEELDVLAAEQSRSAWKKGWP